MVSQVSAKNTVDRSCGFDDNHFDVVGDRKVTKKMPMRSVVFHQRGGYVKYSVSGDD